MFKNMGLTVYKARTYFLHQRQFLFPAILHHSANYKSSLTEQMKCETDVTICGDARFDSMGHSAKYGAYRIFCTNLKKIVDFELVQVNHLVKLFSKLMLTNQIKNKSAKKRRKVRVIMQGKMNTWQKNYFSC